MKDKLKPPDQEHVERELRDLFDYGDIKEVSRFARIPYSSLTKQLNPDCIEESTIFQTLMLLYGCLERRPELEEQVWNLLSRHRARRTRATSDNSFDAAYHNFMAKRAEREDGLCTAEQFEDARNRLAEELARVETGVHVPTRGEAERDLRMSGGS